MLAEQFRTAAAAARNTAALDNVARLLWRAHAEGTIADGDAEAIAGAVQARRATFARPPSGIAVAQAAPASARRRPLRPRSPDRQASLERRRRCAMSGLVPGRLAAAFTLGEVAALSVIAREAQKSGQCLLPIDAIAALAGISRSTTQNALRAAERLGLIQRIERRRCGLPSLPNILRIVSREWTAWLQYRKPLVGLKNVSATDNLLFPKKKNRGAGWRFEARCGRTNKEQDAKGGDYTLDEGICRPKFKTCSSA